MHLPVSEGTRGRATFLPPTWVEAALIAALFVLALIVRLPNLMQVPNYTDEGAEVLWGLDLAQGHHFPLTAIDSYDGPLFSYLVAVLFRLLGVSAEIPRGIALIFGALTVVAVYGLARLMLDRLAGLVAAGLTLTCPLLVIYISHFGWSSSLTPFFAMATAAALYAGVARDKPWLLASSGLLAALSLQSHPTSLTALAGMAIWFLTRPTLRQWLSRPAPYIALGLFLLGYSPIILANVGLGRPFLSDAVQRTYAFVPTLNPPEYLRRLIVLVRFGGFYMGGGIGEGTIPLRLIATIMESLLLAGFVLAWRHGNRLVPTVFLTSLFLLPFFLSNGGYRYYAFLLPMAYVILGILVAMVAHYLWDNPWGTGSIRILQLPAQFILVILLVGFGVFSLQTISDFYRDAFARGLTNEGYFQLVQQVRGNGACGANLFVQAPSINALGSPTEASFAFNNVDFVLRMSDCSHAMLDRSVIIQQLSNQRQSGWLIVLADDVQGYRERLNLSLISTIHPTVFSATTPISLYQVQTIR